MTIISNELQNGRILIGEITRNGVDEDVYIDNYSNARHLPLVYVGSQGSGKSSSLKSNAIDCINNNEPLFVIDYVQDCSLSSGIEPFVPKNKLVVLDLSFELLSTEPFQGLCFNEITIDDSMDDSDKLRFLYLQVQELLSLIDSVDYENPLSLKSKKYLHAAASIVFIQNENSLKSIISCLEDPRKRQMYIKNLTPKQKKYLREEINSLKDLDIKEFNNSETFLSKIESILYKIYFLKNNPIIKAMYNEDTENTINFIDCIKEGKTVLIKINQSDFSRAETNFLATYFLNKIHLASQIQLHTSPVYSHINVLINEVYQMPSVMDKTQLMLTEARTLGLKFLLSVQHFSQLSDTGDILKAIGANFFLLTGSSNDDFDSLNFNFSNLSFGDLIDMPKFHSICLINTGNEYTSFIAKLPPVR